MNRHDIEFQVRLLSDRHPDRNMDAQYKTDLQQLLAQRQPAVVLCLGAPCPTLFQEYRQAADGRSLLTPRLDELDAALENTGRIDLTFVADTLEHMDKEPALHLLARLRDLHGGHVVLLLPLGNRPGQRSSWNDGELLAMGLLQLGRYHGSDGDSALFVFDIDEYKTTPDWLNARFWAHPERWDKDFW